MISTSSTQNEHDASTQTVHAPSSTRCITAAEALVKISCTVRVARDDVELPFKLLFDSPSQVSLISLISNSNSTCSMMRQEFMGKAATDISACAPSICITWCLLILPQT